MTSSIWGDGCRERIKWMESSLTPYLNQTYSFYVNICCVLKCISCKPHNHLKGDNFHFTDKKSNAQKDQ